MARRALSQVIATYDINEIIKPFWAFSFESSYDVLSIVFNIIK